MRNDNSESENSYGAWTVAGGLLILAALLFILKSVLKFRFVLGVGD
jgi:hypothetical protein